MALMHPLYQRQPPQQGAGAAWVVAAWRPRRGGLVRAARPCSSDPRPLQVGLQGAECEMACVGQPSTLLRGNASRRAVVWGAIGAALTDHKRSTEASPLGIGGLARAGAVCGSGAPSALVRDGGQARGGRGLRHFRPERRLAAAQVRPAARTKPSAPAGAPSHTACSAGAMRQIGQVAGP